MFLLLVVHMSRHDDEFPSVRWTLGFCLEPVEQAWFLSRPPCRPLVGDLLFKGFRTLNLCFRIRENGVTSMGENRFL